MSLRLPIGLAGLTGWLLLSVLPVSAQSAAHNAPSTIHLSHSNLKAGQSETVSIQARNLTGKPLAGAAGNVTARYNTRTIRYTLPRTDRQGKASVTFKPPSTFHGGRVPVQATVGNAYLDVSLSAAFQFGKTRVTQGRPSGSIQVTVRALPSQVKAPAPVWIVVSARTKSGQVRSHAPVNLVADFHGGSMHMYGRTDNSGVSTLRIDTHRWPHGQKVAIGVIVRYGNQVGSGGATFSVQSETKSTQPTPVPTNAPTPAPVPISSVPPLPSPTDTPLPPDVSVTATPTPIPAMQAATAVDTPTVTSPATPAPTATGYAQLPGFIAVATSTPTPVSSTPVAEASPAASPMPTNTPSPTSTPIPTNTPAPTATAIPLDCPGSLQGCIQATMNLINDSRAKYSAQYGLNLRPLGLNAIQSAGTGSCVGSIGHSQAMAESGFIWHTNPNYPAASFPNNLCDAQGISAAAENVGVFSSGDELKDLQGIHALMMSESWSPGCVGNHICSILSAQYTQVGIGIYQSGGSTWLTEDFTG